MIELPEKSSTAVHVLADGVTFQWQHDGKIAIFTLTEVARESIDIWVEALRQIVKARSPKEPFLVAHDVSAIALTPYIRQQMEEVIAIADPLPGRYVIIVSKDVLSQSMRLFIMTNLQKPSSRKGDMFTNREKALMWLEEAVV